MKVKEIVISHNTLPPTVLIVRKDTMALKFGNYEIPFGDNEARQLAHHINVYLNEKNR
jgi:CMP-2-keto-3-deoxyoctulosonic acid synthetase